MTREREEAPTNTRSPNTPPFPAAPVKSILVCLKFSLISWNCILTAICSHQIPSTAAGLLPRQRYSGAPSKQGNGSWERCRVQVYPIAQFKILHISSWMEMASFSRPFKLETSPHQEDGVVQNGERSDIILSLIYSINFKCREIVTCRYLEIRDHICAS